MGESLPAVGVHPTATDRSMSILDLARESEARGLKSIYLPEHTHAPVETEVLVPGWPIEERYQRTLDPYVACAFIAATTSLEVGTGVSLVAQHDAIALAKAVATLDYLAQGRMVLGIGFGYNRQEAEDHGFAAPDRFAIVEETIALMRALWTNEVAQFQGRYRQMSLSRSSPSRAGQEDHPCCWEAGRRLGTSAASSPGPTVGCPLDGVSPSRPSSRRWPTSGPDGEMPVARARRRSAASSLQVRARRWPPRSSERASSGCSGCRCS